MAASRSAPFWARLGGLVPSRYTQFYGTRIRVSTGWGVVSRRGLRGFWWVGVAVDGGAADSQGLGDLGDGGAGGQEGGGGFGALGRPYGGAAETGSSSLGRLQAGDCPLDGELALERRQTGDEVDHEAACGGGGVDGFVEAAEVDAASGEVVDGGHGVYDTTRVAGDVVLGEVAPLF